MQERTHTSRNSLQGTTCKLQDLKEIMMSQLLPKLDLKHSNIAIFGDFNINLLNGNVDFLNFMEITFGCKQIVSKITSNYGSVRFSIY
jgi:hypothetical protein